MTDEPTTTETTETRMTNDDLEVGDEISVDGQSWLPKSNLTVTEVDPEWSDHRDATVFIASGDWSNARDYTFEISESGYAKTTNASGYWGPTVTVYKIEEVDADDNNGGVSGDTDEDGNYAYYNYCTEDGCDWEAHGTRTEVAKADYEHGKTGHKTAAAREDDDPDIWSDANEADRRLLGSDDEPEPMSDGGITLEEAARTDGTTNLRAGGFDAKQVLRHRISRGDSNA